MYKMKKNKTTTTKSKAHQREEVSTYKIYIKRA